MNRRRIRRYRNQEKKFWDEILRYYWYNDYSGNMRILDSSICHRSTSRVRYGSSETGSPVKIDGSTRPKR